MRTKYLGIDLSFAKTGWAVIEVEKRIPKLLTCGLIKSDVSKTAVDRIDDTVTEVKLIASKITPSAIIKEASIIARISTATPVIKTHAVYEHELSRIYPLHDLSNATIKAWARTVTGSDGKRSDKAMIAEAVESISTARYRRYGRRRVV